MLAFCTSIAPVLKSTFVTLPPSVRLGSSNSVELALKVCPSLVEAEHCTSNSLVLGEKPSSENGISNAVSLSGTEAEATSLPLIDTETLSEVELSLAEAALMAEVKAISEYVTRVSTTMVPLVSSSRYGRKAGEQRNARRGVSDVVGMGNWPPGGTTVSLGR